MSDVKKIFADAFAFNAKDLLNKDALVGPAKIKLNPRSFLDRSGLDNDEIGAIEEASQASELTEAYERWAAQGGARDCTEGAEHITQNDREFIIACRQLFHTMLEREERRRRA